VEREGEREGLEGSPDSCPSPGRADGAGLRQEILGHLSRGPAAVDALLAALGPERSGAIQAELLTLELLGWIDRMPGGRIRRAS